MIFFLKNKNICVVYATTKVDSKAMVKVVGTWDLDVKALVVGKEGNLY